MWIFPSPDPLADGPVSRVLNSLVADSLAVYRVMAAVAGAAASSVQALHPLLCDDSVVKCSSIGAVSMQASKHMGATHRVR